MKRNRKLTYSFEDIKSQYEQRGYFILDDDYFSYEYKINCKDEFGYKYFIEPKKLIGQNRRPKQFHNSNPHTIDNIKLWMIKNNINKIELLSKNYNNSEKLILKCLECGEEFERNWSDLQSYKINCPYCLGRILSNSNCLATINPKIASEWHYELNGNLTPYDITKSIRKKVWWQCPNNKDHVYDMSVDARNSGNNCPYCSSRRIDNTNNLQYKYPEIAKEWDCELNKITPDKIFPNSNKKYYWICNKNKNHKWKSSPNSRVAGDKGCPYCNKSNGEDKIQSILDNIGVKYIVQKTFKDCRFKKPLRFDFYIESHNICIEYQGIQHYEPIDFASNGKNWAIKEYELNIIKDNIKKEYCKNNNIHLLEIPYYENDIEDLIFGLFI